MRGNTNPWPALAQIQAWDAAHLEVAADHWAARAQAWEAAYTAVHHQASNPAGTPWEGEAADATYERIGADRYQVMSACDVLHSVSRVAREGAGHIYAARRAALDAIKAARAEGFDVDDDLSIIDRTVPRTPAVYEHRLARATVHATTIWSAADDLTATDTAVARSITAAVSGLDLQFVTGQAPEEPPAELFTHPVPGIGPLPAGPHLIYCHPSARSDFWWCEGYDVGGGGPYGFDSPIDVSGVA